jgi:hypothetical protein
VSSSDEWDRRRYARIPAGELVSFSPFAGASGLGEARNISLGGICFTVVGCKVEPGDLLQVSFNVGEETVNAVGRIVRATALDDITLEIGLEFVRIDPWAVRLLEEREDVGAAN